MPYTNPFEKIEGTVPQTGAGGHVPYSTGDSFAELLGALMAQQQYEVGREQEGQRMLQQQAAAVPRQARAGVQQPQQQQSAQLAQQGAKTGPVFTDPMVEALMAQKMQMALSDQNYRMMVEIMQRNQPSALQKFGPLAATGLGMLVGGPMLGGGYAGAGLGGQIGGGLGQVFRM